MAGNMFFTRIKDPKLFRKRLLESSKDIINVLKDHQIILQLRAEKNNVITDLKKQFEDLNKSLADLDKYMPEDAIKKLEEMLPKKKVEKPKPVKKASPKKSPKKVKKSAVKKDVEKKKELSEIEKLESALSKIEKKLNEI